MYFTSVFEELLTSLSHALPMVVNTVSSRRGDQCLLPMEEYCYMLAGNSPFSLVKCTLPYVMHQNLCKLYVYIVFVEKLNKKS